MQKAKTIALWVLQVLLAVMFNLVGTGKFLDRSWEPRFRAWGYPDHFYQVIGALEALGGLALLVPRLAGFAAAGLMLIMTGAAATHLAHGEKNWPSPVIFLLLLSVVAAGRLRFRRRQETAAVNQSTRTA
jgi:uncharacterized membrane protein YphA (DoxX/SURF4 family)